MLPESTDFQPGAGGIRHDAIIAIEAAARATIKRFAAQADQVQEDKRTK
jgi:hypothetical protein